jgi:glucokinase
MREKNLQKKGFAVNNVLAVDIGSSHVRVGVFDHEGTCLKVTEDSLGPRQPRDSLLEQLRLRCVASLQESDERVAACGVSFGGMVDFDRQLATSLHLPGWERFPLADWLQQNLGIPCRVDNDANTGALGELRFGAGQGIDSMAFVLFGQWLRCSLVQGGRLWRGKDGLAGELGHVPVSESGTLCSCGARGCLELFCSGAAIANAGRGFAGRRPEAVSPVARHSGGSADGITAKAVAEAAAEGDEASVQILRDTVSWLARTLLTIVRIFNPEKVIVGGDVAQAGAVLWEPLREALKARESAALPHLAEIVPASLGARASLYGAAVLALELPANGGLVTK